MTTWYRSTTNRLVSSHTSQATELSELNSFFIDCAAEGASFTWQVASYQSTSPQYLVLKRKNGTPGRLMIFGNSAAGPAAAAMIGAGGYTYTGALYVTYDPTATSDTPTASYTAANPWSAANSRGRKFQTVGTIQTHRLRAYCTDDGQLFIHAYGENVSHTYVIHAGPIFRAATGGSVFYEGLCVMNGLATTGLAFMVEADPSSLANYKMSFGTPGQSDNGNSGATDLSYCSAYIGGTWYQVNRITGGRFNANSMTDSVNRMHYLPIIWATTPDSSVVTPSVIKSKNIGIGPCRVRDAVLIDNNAQTRGFYVGYHSTQGSDLSAFSLLNDDI